MSLPNEEALRSLVRDTIARRLGEFGRSSETGNGAGAGTEAGSMPPGAGTARIAGLHSHASHFRYTLTESDGPCLIEPGVQCNHCGYCQSHGH